MSALTDAIANPTVKLCSVARAGAELEASDPESWADFQAWMASPRDDVDRITDQQMWIGLQRLNFRVGKQTLGRHRRQQGECGCSL